MTLPRAPKVKPPRSVVVRWAGLVMCALLTLLTTPASAAPECEFGQGRDCNSSADCATNAAATLCAGDGETSTCEVPCDDGSGHPDPSACSLGETCVATIEPGLGGGETHYCKLSKFSMDLNLLDACVFHFIEGLAPDLSSDDECSLVDNLSQMLDQDGNRSFNIFDVDLCVRAFLDEQACDTATQSCPDEQTYCAGDDDCGAGLFCDQDLNKCVRECGYVVSREGQSLITVLDRECSGRLKTCDYDSGRCSEADLSGATCQVEQDCPTGAYCFLGSCQPTCYRAIDCPGSDWFCGPTNQCLPKPKPGSVGDAPFNPKNYSVQFAQTELALSPVNDSYDVPLLIMDLVTKKQVFEQPNAVFGYRLEVKYDLKQDDKCRQDLSDLSEEDRADCLISPDEEFLTLGNPFGTIFGSGDPTVQLGINPGTSRELTPGLYQATVSAIFSNGGRTSTRVLYRKPSPSGEYIGRSSVYVDGPANLLGSSNLGLRLFIDKSERIAWDDLLTENNITARDFIDKTRGFRISGFIHGATSMMLNWPGAKTDAENEIPVTGIYADQLGQMHLIAVIDYEPDFCRSENGLCSGDAEELVVRNAFKRKIRRVVELIGPFNEQLNRFEGVYREAYSGLTPSDFTLDGGFILDQVGQDETPVVLGKPLVAASQAAAVGFVTQPQLLSQVQADITASCKGASASLTSKFASKAAFQSYVATFDGGGPIFASLQQFEDRVATALDTLENSNGSHLTLADFFKGKITFCDGTESESCVDRTQLRCGLSLYRKAILSDWVDFGTLGYQGTLPSCTQASDCGTGHVCVAGQCRVGCDDGTGQPVPSKCSGGTCNDDDGVLFCAASSFDANLFCKDVPGTTPDCPTKAGDEPALVTLQDHNRFYRELVQAHGYQAGGAAREAFFTLFRAANGDPLDEASAYAYKELHLRNAIGDYDAVREEVFSAPSAAVLFGWPMNYFATRGDVWLKQMHATVGDRMQMLIELVDHRRRVLKSSGQQDHLFAEHVLHQEYLQQVFLMALERHWEEWTFAYSGRSQTLMDLGNELLAKSQDTRNPLGLHPNRIYFENADLSSSNWQNFRNRLQQEMPLLKGDVQTAITEMKGSLSDQDSFERSLLLEQQDVEAQIETLCGEDADLPDECLISLADKKLETSCTGPDCLLEFTCEDSAPGETSPCDKVIQRFQAAGSNEAACRADTVTHSIPYQGGTRNCVRGRVGALSQEKVSLELQRTQITRNVQSLIRQIARQTAFITQAQTRNEDLIEYLETKQLELGIVDAGLAAADVAWQLATTTAQGLDCLVIVGLATGTDCPQKLASAGLKNVALGIRAAVDGALNVTRNAIVHGKEITLTEDSQARELEGMRMTLDNMVTEVENHVASYEAVTQQLFNIDVQIQDALFQAERISIRHDQKIEQLVDHLIGRASGDVLTSNRKVMQANQRFQKMLVEAYKMTRAFVHRFNLDTQAEAWSNRVYEIVTIQDLEKFIAFLDGVEQNYCGAAGLDCDYINNGEVFEFSVQKQLFPGLRDIVDPNTGKVLTIGQQFHNLLTSSAFVKRRARPYGLSSQIEVPFAIWLNDRGDAGGAPQRFMVSPGDCNHIIRGKGGQGGTVAVNVLGTRLPKSPGIKFELWRGNTDYIRSCTEKVNSFESQISTYIVGWTPTSALGQLDNPPSFYTQSGELSACINNSLLQSPSTVDSQDGCFRFFARDRSLGAPDYSLIIPQVDGDQDWLLGDGLPDNEKPIVEDVVLYFRYNDRPITGN